MFLNTRLTLTPFSFSAKKQKCAESVLPSFCKIVAICTHLLSHTLTYIECNDISLEYWAWWGYRDRFRGLSIDEVSSNKTVLKPQVEIQWLHRAITGYERASKLQRQGVIRVREEPNRTLKKACVHPDMEG